MESENTSRQMKIKTQLSKSLGCSKSSSKREVNIDTRLLLRNKKKSNKQPNLPLKQNIKRRRNKAQSQQEKEKIQNRQNFQEDSMKR